MKYTAGYEETPYLVRSPPARGAWIEMGSAWRDQLQPMVAPARGAWIEMLCRKVTLSRLLCRPPHGGRGLK